MQNDENIKPNTITNENNTLNLELQQYLQLNRIKRKENIFQYWKSVEKTFPILSKIALKQISIIGSSIPSKRLFSKAGLIKRDNRNRLSGKHLNMLLFLSSLSQEDWGLI